MLRRSTSFDTRPMPMKMAMKRPKTDGRRQPEILDDLDVLPGGQLPEQIRRRDQQDGKEHEVVGHAVPDRLAEHADGDAPNRAHETPPAPGPRRSGLRHAADEEVFERVANRIERHEPGARRDEVRQHALGRGVERQLDRVASRRDFGRAASDRREAREHVGRHAGRSPAPSRALRTPGCRSAGRPRPAGRRRRPRRGCRAPRRRRGCAS